MQGHAQPTMAAMRLKPAQAASTEVVTRATVRISSYFCSLSGFRTLTMSSVVSLAPAGRGGGGRHGGSGCMHVAHEPAPQRC